MPGRRIGDGHPPIGEVVRSYVLRRTALMILVIFGVVSVSFFVLRFASGDPARLLNPPGTPESTLQITRERLGTDKPILEQYVNYLAALTRADLGTAFRGGRAVLPSLLEALPNTILLGVVTMIVGSTIGLLLGVAAALRPNGPLDRAVLLLATIGQSTPNFWLAVILVLVFAIKLRLLPAIDMRGPQSFVLPVATLAITLSPLIIRAVRQSFIETLGEDFVRAARARGIPERRVLFVHVLKVAAIPLITLIGLQTGFVLGGAYVIESIFNWPGVGNLTLQSIQGRDFPMIQGAVLVTATIIVLVNFTVDIVYAVLDPRIRY
jgi:ABC-type dipeptide/oligopeptide/nickel transport system permease component